MESIKNLNIRRIFYLLFSISICSTSFANTQNFGTFWLTGIFIGPFVNEYKQWKYYLEPRLILIDDRYGLDEAHLYSGAGYQITPNFTPYIGYAYFLSENTQGVVAHENVLWQQFLWKIHHSKFFNISNRSRLEERKNTLYAEWATRLREQIALKIPFQNTKYSLSTFDEGFFNFNHPSWVSDKFFAENRFFFGLERQLSKAASFDFGYIEQTKFQRNNQNLLTHGLYLKITVTQ
ncbi:Protein of uncharacterised function (DUF2490) [Legionella steigerwaltii]|uniref:Protein of uncharacterized function (DUF2490) n=1 Tax=Legionella steigerwaltii TaxID=460 RepID=A0A378L6E7_9GAMM|nr:DUF2490 domain-containing protein [Legionella steigerwaltii]KTD77407.1 hypothetical protein Lstg_1764 [Legionella steigerwaltii]STY22287.1 Protein of uncharacterised function (DUF2490) [Legionella steigerwaltii]